MRKLETPRENLPHIRSIDLDPTEAWMERQLLWRKMRKEERLDTCGNEPLQSSWVLLEEVMHLFCTASVRYKDPYGRNYDLPVNYLSRLVGGSNEPPYWEDYEEEDVHC
jgi:hypothetical protein